MTSGKRLVDTKYGPGPGARETWQGRASSGERVLVAFARATPTTPRNLNCLRRGFFFLADRQII